MLGDGSVSKINRTAQLTIHGDTTESERDDFIFYSDQETSLVQAVYKYVQATGDVSILDEKINGKTIGKRLEWSMEFLLNHRYDRKHGLLWDATVVSLSGSITIFFIGGWSGKAIPATLTALPSKKMTSWSLIFRNVRFSWTKKGKNSPAGTS